MNYKRLSVVAVLTILLTAALSAFAIKSIERTHNNLDRLEEQVEIFVHKRNKATEKTAREAVEEHEEKYH